MAGLALIFDATYSVPVETETTKGNTECTHTYKYYAYIHVCAHIRPSCDTMVIHNNNLTNSECCSKEP